MAGRLVYRPGTGQGPVEPSQCRPPARLRVTFRPAVTTRVIILNWNGRPWLERSLAALARQTHPADEIVVVDNGSADDSVAWVPGLPAMWWDFYEAYPIKWDGPTFNASSNTVATETLVLTHNGITKPKASQVLSAVRGVASLGGIL